MRKLAYDKAIITKELLQSLYSKGVSRAQVSRDYNVPIRALKHAENELGVPLPIRQGHRKFYDVSPVFLETHREQFEKFLELHNQGMTYTQIAEACGCSPSQVGKLFTVYGYSFDTAYKTKAAHEAIKGKKRSYDDLCRRAIGKERKPPKMSRWEVIFNDWLTANNIPFTYSKACGKYNIDFAIGNSVAMELYGGAFHAEGRAAARLNERIKYLFDSGWNVYTIWCLSKESTIFPGCLDDFIAFLERSRSDKSFRRQYRVIWSDGDFISVGSDESDYVPCVIPPARRHEALAKYRAPRD